MTHRSVVCVLGLVFCQIVSTPAAANELTADTYDELIDDAVREFQLGNFLEARTLFEQAHAQRPNARTLRSLGFCAFELKHYTQALGELEAALEDPRMALTEAQRADVQLTLDKAQRYVGSLILDVEPAGAELSVDGQPANPGEMRVDLGEHVIAASAEGYRSREQRVMVSGGQRVRVRLQLSPDALSPERVAAAHAPASAPAQTPAPAPSRSKSVFERWWFWTLAGVAVSGIAVTTIIVLGDQAPPPGEASFSSTGLTLHPPAPGN